jgi:hypothetical protein
MDTYPKISWFIVTFAHDFDWLVYLLKSLARYATGFHETVILIPDADKPLLDRFGLTAERVVTFADAGFKSGFMHHQYLKCCADLYCPDADFIAHIDSDCVLTSPVTPGTYLTTGEVGRAVPCAPPLKAINLCTKYSSLNGASPWQPGTEKLLGEPVEYETMRRHCSVYPRSLYPNLRAHIQNVHNMPMEELIRPMPRNGPFSEFNLLGAYGMKYCNDIHWIDTDIHGTPPNPVHQFWSHHRPTNPDVQKKLSEFGLL